VLRGGKIFFLIAHVRVNDVTSKNTLNPPPQQRTEHVLALHVRSLGGASPLPPTPKKTYEAATRLMLLA
jgi:hypothetical protein